MLDGIGKLTLRAPEVAESGNKQQGSDGQRDELIGRTPRIGAEQRPAKRLDDPAHRIQGEEQPVLLGHDVGREADRGDVESELHEERDDKAEVAILDGERGKPEACPERRGQSLDEKQRQQQDLQRRSMSVPKHEAREQRAGDEQIDESDEYYGGRRDEPREVDLRDQVGVVQNALRTFSECRGKERPGKHAGHDKQRIGNVAGGRELCELTEEHGKDDHRQQRTQQRPGDADRGLFVADREVTPSKEEEEFAVVPEVAPVLARRATGLDDEFLIAQDRGMIGGGERRGGCCGTRHGQREPSSRGLPIASVAGEFRQVKVGGGLGMRWPA